MKKAAALLLALAMIFAMTACGEKKTAVDEKDPIAAYKGSYTDKTSERANLDLVPTEEGKEGYSILVSWNSGAYEADTWYMSISYEDGKLVYKDCIHENHSWLPTGEDKVTVVAENQEGYFEIDKKGNLCWKGAADDYCVDCVFEKN